MWGGARELQKSILTFLRPDKTSVVMKVPKPAADHIGFSIIFKKKPSDNGE